MANTQQHKLDNDIQTVRHLYAVHEVAHAMIAAKNNIKVLSITLSDTNEFFPSICLTSLFKLPLEDQLDYFIAGIVAVDLFRENYGEEDCCDLIKDKHAKNDMVWINNLIKHNKKSATPIRKSITKIKKEAYDRTYKYLEPRFLSIFTMGCQLTALGILDSEDIDRCFGEVCSQD